MGIKAFEIKMTGRASDSMLSGLRAFLKDFPLAKAFLIYGGERTMRDGGIEILPLKKALLELPAILQET